MDLAARLREDAALVEEALGKVFAQKAAMADLYAAMEYSLLAGGKRLRPILTLEVCRMLGGEDAVALPLACGVEMVHTYSLIHDDLPCMDDDDLRRGKPTNHKVYGEATAVLAGDGLLAAAFETVAAAPLPPERAVTAVQCLAHAAGPAGMVGGQALDMAGEGHSLVLDEVKELQKLKTGALIAAAARLGCIAAGCAPETEAAVVRFASKLGLAFQIQDDILDVSGDAAVLGKPVGSDQAHEKTTFVSLLGVERCGEEVDRLTAQAIEALEGCPNAEVLQALAKSLVGRRN